MSKRLQVLIVEDEYLEIQAIARRRRMTVSEWIRQALRKAMDDQPGNRRSQAASHRRRVPAQFPNS